MLVLASTWQAKEHRNPTTFCCTTTDPASGSRCSKSPCLTVRSTWRGFRSMTSSAVSSSRRGSTGAVSWRSTLRCRNPRSKNSRKANSGYCWVRKETSSGTTGSSSHKNRGALLTSPYVPLLPLVDLSLTRLPGLPQTNHITSRKN